MRRLAWALWGFDVVVIAGLVAVGSDPAGRASEAAAGIDILAFATMGALVVARHPRNPLGWLLCEVGLVFAVGGLVLEYHDREPGATFAAWLGSFVFELGVVPAATLLLLLFPNGRLPSRGWRPWAWLSVAALALIVAGSALAPGVIEGTDVENPLGIPGAGAVMSAVATAGAVALAVSVAASVASLIVRFRRAEKTERQQLKWIAYAAPIVALAMVAALVIDSASSGPTAVGASNTITGLGIAAVPVTIGIAVLRHRLYDIDVVINRTLVYGALTAALAGTYLALVLLIGLAVGHSGFAVAVSTLAVAALFRPLRARIQATVDRRFYRRRYDARQTLEAFGVRLRDELDLEALGADLRGVVRDTVQPAHVSLWLRSEP